MKKKMAELFCMTAVVSMLLTGCSGDLSGLMGGGKGQTDSMEEQAEEPEAGESEPAEGTEAGEMMTEAETEDSAADEGGFADGAWLPARAMQMASEKEPNELVRAAIIDEYMIPEDEWEMTRYYYNYVDLNDDGEKEIFALAVGPSVSGSGGSSALLLKENGEVMQTFTLVNPPVLVTDETDEGYHRLALMRSGGGAESEVVLLSWKNGAYENVSGAETTADPETLSGTAILCNDLAADMESGEFLTLSE